MKILFLTFLTLIFLLFSVSAEDGKTEEKNKTTEVTASFDISLIYGLGSVKKCKGVTDACLTSLCDQYFTIITDTTKVAEKIEFAKALKCVGDKFYKKMYNASTFEKFTSEEFSDCVGENEAYTKLTTLYTKEACTTYFTAKFSEEAKKASGKIEISETGVLGYDKTKCQEQITKAKEALTSAQKVPVTVLETCISGKVTVDNSFTGYTGATIDACITVYLKSNVAVKSFIASYLEGYCGDTTKVDGDALKALTFSDLYAQTNNLKTNKENKKTAFLVLKDKIKGTDDNPCDTAEGVSKVLKMAEELGTNETELVDIFTELEIKLKKELETDTSGEYCATVGQYLMVSEKLMISNSQGESGDFKTKVKSATNLYISCANFLSGSESLQLQNSKLTMQTFDPDSASSVNLTSGSNKIVLGGKALAFIKTKAGITEDGAEIIATISSATKASSGLSTDLMANITASEIVTAEFKKKNSAGVTDITIGSLSDNTTLSVEFSTEVETKGNKCVRLENKAWVASGEFEATSTTKSTTCLMNHASEYTIISDTISGKTDDNDDFGSKIGASLLMVILFVLLL